MESIPKTWKIEANSADWWNHNLPHNVQKAKMYLPTKASNELGYQRPLLVLWIPKMLTLLGLMKVVFNLH